MREGGSEGVREFVVYWGAYPPKKTKIDAKSYRMLYKLNENTKISVSGESKTAPIKDSVGQGSFAAALVSLINIGSAIADMIDPTRWYYGNK